MKIINASAHIISPVREDVLEWLEIVARTCYKSEDKITHGSAERLVKSLLRNGHEAMLEHYSVTVKFIVDRGVSHEIVRHRMASYAQESTRYCNYSGNMGFIMPCYFDADSLEYVRWLSEMMHAEDSYNRLIAYGRTPQEARAVLPNSLKTELIMTANLREWRHFFKLRAVGTTGKPHPQMLEVTIPLLDEFKRAIPVVFDDLEAKQ